MIGGVLITTISVGTAQEFNLKFYEKDGRLEASVFCIISNELLLP